ncbi:MAG: alkyl sulfatase dimerization domain-containing protein [Pseudomonadota bacterium]
MSLREVILIIAAFATSVPLQAQQMSKPASSVTQRTNHEVLQTLPFNDDEDFRLIQRGFIASLDDLAIENSSGRVVFDQSAFEFIAGEAPPSVNPSLWRQAKLNAYHGLYEVMDGIYQVRGYDVSNMTFIRGNKGWIVVDAMLSMEPAQAGLDLVFEHLGERPITAVIITHSHGDHFGGLQTLVGDDTEVIVPEGFLKHVGSEGIIAGAAMTRRVMYQFAPRLHKNERGHVDSGLGKGISAGGTRSLVPPTLEIKRTGERHTIDGVEFVFQVTPGAEAPAEIMFYLPEFKALCVAEMANATMHNLYTLRGATVRDGLIWSKHLNDSLELFGSDLDLVFGSHHWPRFGRAKSVEFISKQRDLYRYIHDQTVRMMSNGFTPREIAEQLALPPSLDKEFYNRGYYGTLSHNAKAVYQYYLGWFDGVPANLNPHPPSEAGARYVLLAGGAESLLKHARESYAKGDYRWVAELVNHLVFAEPDNSKAKALLADTYEQLGYQAESAIWRDFYLTGAQELRTGKTIAAPGGFIRPTLLPAMPTELLLDYLAVRLNPTGLEEKTARFNLEFTDRSEEFLLFLENSVLHNRENKKSDVTDASVRLTRLAIVEWASGAKTIDQLIDTGQIEVIEGNPQKFKELFNSLEPFDLGFNIVTP